MTSVALAPRGLTRVGFGREWRLRAFNAQFGLIPFVAVLVLSAPGPWRSTIRGTVSMKGTGELLPGVAVTAKTDGIQQTAYTDAGGRYELTELRSGTYELSAELPGLCAPILGDIEVGVAETVVVDMSMELTGMLTFVDYVIPIGGLPAAYAVADAVVHLRIVSSGTGKPWGRGDTLCGGVIGVEHVAVVLGVAKVDPLHGPNDAEVRFIQYPAGRWSEGAISAEGSETPYSAGEEYVAFLEWDKRFERFTMYVGTSFILPVQDGQVSLGGWAQPDLPGLHDKMTVRAFFSALRTLSDEGEQPHTEGRSMRSYKRQELTRLTPRSSPARR